MDNRKVISGYTDILEYLYSSYYRFDTYSGVTSSHWRKVGWQNVVKQDSEYQVSGYGFGSYRPYTFANRFKSLPTSILLRNLLKKYSCEQSLIQAANEVTHRSNHISSFDSVKQTLSLDATLKALNKLSNKHRQQINTLANQGVKSVCVIGDGYGFLANLLKVLESGLQVISVNLGRTLLFDVLFSKRVLPSVYPALLNDKGEEKEVLQNHELIFIEAEKFDILRNFKIDLFINIDSMQEMDASTISKYFMYMRSSQQVPCYFYCCNRISKKLPDGQLINFFEYPWSEKDKIIFDELCPWHQEHPTSKPPFWLPFDGPFQHRLVILDQD
jgi:hypothetical protein